MTAHIGCEENRKTPLLEERVCPVCGEEVEVFTRDGRLIDDFTCECGYVFHAEEPLVPSVPKAKKAPES